MYSFKYVSAHFDSFSEIPDSCEDFKSKREK